LLLVHFPPINLVVSEESLGTYVRETSSWVWLRA